MSSKFFSRAALSSFPLTKRPNYYSKGKGMTASECQLKGYFLVLTEPKPTSV